MPAKRASKTAKKVTKTAAKASRRGKTASPYGLGQRKSRAFERFLQGWTNAEIARELHVTADTVSRYRAEYEAQIHEQARQNPRLLLDLIPNTVRALI